MHRVTAIVLAWREEPWLGRCVRSLLSSKDVDIDVIVVDNGCTDGSVEKIKDVENVRVLDPGRNLGFAAGCNLGAAEATGDYLFFLNSDAWVDDRCVHRLIEGLRHDVAVTTASVRLADRPNTINAAGNPLHYLGFSWAGGHGTDACHATSFGPIASGAAMAIARGTFNELGGFCEEYFAYHEDTELSWRIWSSGRSVRCVTDAVAYHAYDEARTPEKLYWIERNRLVFLLTAFSARTIMLLIPMLLLVEGAVLAVAVHDRWAGRKLAGWRWIFAHRRWILDRRRMIAAARTRTDAELCDLLTDQFDPAELGVPFLRPVNAVSRAYWRTVRRFLR